MARYQAPPAKVASFLGLARRAGAVTLGRSACRRAVQAGRVQLLVLAQGAGASIERDSGAHEGVPVLQSALSKEELGQRMGRHAVAVVGLMDADLVRGLLQLATPLDDDTSSGDEKKEDA